MLQKFLPTLFFLLRFLGAYIISSVAYGLYIAHFDEIERTDPFTRSIVFQVAEISEAMGYETRIRMNAHLDYPESGLEQTFDTLYFDGRRTVSVEEGCNGLNVMFLFASFLFAFGGQWKRMLWFLPTGLILIHLANLMRLYLLAILNITADGRYFHFFHKYGFTSVLYLMVLLLWALWVGKKPAKDA